MRLRLTLLLVCLLACAFPTAAQEQVSVDFEQFPASQTYTQALPFSADVFKINGGQLLWNLPPDRTHLYGTANFQKNAGYVTNGGFYANGALFLSFTKPVSKLQFSLVNMAVNDASTNQFTITDDLGNRKVYYLVFLCNYGSFLAPCQIDGQNGPDPQTIVWPYDGVSLLTIVNTSNCCSIYSATWNFGVDNISYSRLSDHSYRVVVGFTDNTTFQYKTAGLDSVKATMPLGSRIRVQLQELGADNAWHAVSSKFRLNAQGVLNNNVTSPSGVQFAPLNKNALFPTSVVFGYANDPNTAKDYQDYQSVHLGTQHVTIQPSDDANVSIGLNLVINQPKQIGEEEPTDATNPKRNPPVVNDKRWDWAITKYAHESGIPPQYVKQQMFQEGDSKRDGYFAPHNWLYEMQARDYNVVQRGCAASGYRHCDEWPHYFLDGGDFLCPQAPVPVPGGATCANPVDDIAARQSLKIIRNGGLPRPIDPMEVGVTARMIYDAEHLNYAKVWFPTGVPFAARRRAVGGAGDPLAFIAQTPEASSYGFMQVVWTDVIDKMGWATVNGRHNPALLFDDDFELAHGYSSLRVGTQYLSAMFRANNPKGLADTPVFASLDDFDDSMFNAWSGYNAGSYGSDVAKLDDMYYPPAGSVSIFSDCTPPSVTASATSVTVPPGATALLEADGFDAAPSQYQWYGGVTGDVTHPVPGAVFSTFAVVPTSSTSYWAQATNECGAASTATISVAVSPLCATPNITSMTDNPTITAGTSTDLSVHADGDNVQYLWFAGQAATAVGETGFGDVAGSGATIHVSPVATTNYWVRASNTCGFTESGNLTVTVQPCMAPKLLAQPQDATVVSGGMTTLQVSVSGSAPITYAWYSGISGDSSLQIGTGPSVSVGAGQYWVRVSTPCASVDSNTAQVTESTTCTPPTIAAQPSDTTVSAGSPATLQVSATGTGLQYQWYAGATGDTAAPVLGATGSSFSFLPTTSGVYWARVTNTCGSVDSADANVAVSSTCIPPQITSLSGSQQIAFGTAAPLSVTASGSSALAYQWYVGTTGDVTRPVVGATSTLYLAKPATTTQYWVRVSNACGAADSSTVTVTVTGCTGPSITSQPLSATVTAGTPVTLTVSATGQAPFTYQWYLGQSGDVSSPVLNGTTSTLSFIAAASASYWVRVTDACSSANSQTAIITLVSDCVRPTILTQPLSTSTLEGQSVDLSVVGSGTTPLTFQWYSGTSGDTSAPLNNATGPRVTVSPTTDASYWVRITNACGSVDSATATVTVILCDSVEIASQPVSTIITAGDSATLTVGVSGTGPFTAHWYVGVSGDFSQPLIGLTALSIPVQPSVTTSYWVEVTNACGTADSAAATVVVLAACTPPAITSDPASMAITAGDSATLSVGASGSDPLAYQWFAGESGDETTPIGGATSSTFTVSPPTSTNFWVEVTNGCGIASSATATVTVNPVSAPQIVTQPAAQSISAGSSTPLSAEATGTAPLSYTWYVGEAPDISQVVGSGQAIAISPATTTSYWVRVSNARGTADSHTATITVAPSCISPSVLAIAASSSITAGDSVSLTARTSGTGPFGYTWYLGAPSDISAPVGTGPSISVAPSTSSSYWVRASNSCGFADSGAVPVAVVQPCNVPGISVQPLSQTVATGGSANLSVSATGTGPIAYQWYANGSAMPGDTASSVTVRLTSSTDYFVRITDSCGFADSDTASITVNTCSGCSGGGPQQISGARLAPPAHVTAASKGQQLIGLSWQSVTPIDAPVYYEIWRSDAGAPFRPVATTTAVLYRDHNLLKNKSYRYFVVATDVTGLRASAASNQATATAY